jgi:hypothetical protein
MMDLGSLSIPTFQQVELKARGKVAELVKKTQKKMVEKKKTAK